MRSSSIARMHAAGGIRLRILVALSLVLLAAQPALAEECEVTTSGAPVDTGAGPGPRYYVLWDPCFDLCWFPWVYEESNGIAGLQRGDEVVDDTCGGRIAADTIVL